MKRKSKKELLTEQIAATVGAGREVAVETVDFSDPNRPKTCLDPVAWFVVQSELAPVDVDDVKRLLADIEAEVKPQIMPYYACDGPNPEKGKWFKKVGAGFQPAGSRGIPAP